MLKRRSADGLLGHLDVDVLLQADDAEPELLQLAQRQPPALVRPPVGVGREHVERLAELAVHCHRYVNACLRSLA